MNIIYLLIAVSTSLALFFLGAFMWAVKSGQFDDSYSPAVRMLMDDTIIEEDNQSTNHNTNTL